MGLFDRFRSGRDAARRENLTASSGLDVRGRSIRSASSSLDIAIRPQEDQHTYLREAGLYFDVSDDDDLAELRSRIRSYAIYNDTLSIVVNLCSLLITKSPTIQCDDGQNAEKLTAFFEGQGYESFLQRFVREYLISGEATSFASWSDEAHAFSREQILNPDQIVIKPSIFENEDKIYIGVPEKVKAVFEDPDNPEYQTATTSLRDLYRASTSNLGLDVDSDKIIRVENKMSDWDMRGTPFFTPALAALAQSESLDAALFEQLSTLITPTIIGTVGLKAGELGPSTPAWVPTQGELDAIKDTYRQMIMGRFRLGLFTIGVHFENAFAGSQIPSLDADYQRVEQRILRCVGAGRSLIDGTASGPFGNTATANRDIFAQFLESIQTQIIEAFQKRIDLAVRRLNIYAYRTNDAGVRTKLLDSMGNPIYEDAHLAFQTDGLKNANEKLQSLLQLRKQGIPVSRDTMIQVSESGLSFEDEMKKTKKEAELMDALGIDDRGNLKSRGGSFNGAQPQTGRSVAPGGPGRAPLNGPQSPQRSGPGQSTQSQPSGRPVPPARR